MNKDIEDIYKLFTENFPYIIRAENTARSIIGNMDNIILEKRADDNSLIACAVVNENTIILLCVEEKYRNKGIGSELLSKCEKVIFDKGYDSVILGAGFDYLMPGVPTTKRFAPAIHENLLPILNTSASDFFEKRGYEHFWGNCNCFDMFMPLDKFKESGGSIGDCIDGVTYRWAIESDVENIVKCVDDACQFGDESFSKYYRNPDFYNSASSQKVLVACKDEIVVGALIVSIGVEHQDVGSVGCTSVCTSQTHKGIGTTLIKLGTQYLKSLGLKNAFLGYTYSGLDKMYGEAGYEISIYYFMGRKSR